MGQLHGQDLLQVSLLAPSQSAECSLTHNRWPVIVGIVVGGLVLFSVVFCIARCICCGAECAICCCKCCTCCCSSGGGRSGHKRMKSEPSPIYPPYAAAGAPSPYAQASAAAPLAPFDPRPVNQQYRSHAAPAFAPAPVHERPQFATFESPSKPVNEDALPAMPSWQDARDVHVEVAEPVVPEKRGDMEMERLNHNGSMAGSSMTGMAAVGAARRSPGPSRSPISPAGDGYGYNQGFEHEPLVGGAMPRSPHQSPGPYGRPYAQQDAYQRGSPAQNLSPVYGAGEGYAQTQPYNRRPSPAQPLMHSELDNHYDHQDVYTQPYHSPSPPIAMAPSHNDYASNPVELPSPNTAYPQQHNNTPAYAPSDSTRFEPSDPPTSAYPGQRSYTPQSAYPGQQSYQAFIPGQTGQQYAGVSRKAVDGTYRDL
jgi:hypothetical protein